MLDAVEMADMEPTGDDGAVPKIYNDKGEGARTSRRKWLKWSKSWDTWPGQFTLAGSYVPVTPCLSSDVRK